MTAGTISDLTAQQTFDSLTGFDEIAIAKYFDRDVLSLSKADRARFGRSLCFVALRRSGLKDTEAYDRVMAMTLTETTEAFASEPDDDSAAALEALDTDGLGEAP